MHQFVPLTSVLVKIRRVPKVLVELAVLEARKLRVEVGGYIEKSVEPHEIDGHSREVKSCVNLYLVCRFHRLDNWYPFVFVDDINGHKSSDKQCQF